ncbi:MAG TPA: HEAT repeat domain-containing protein [Elusimicrobiota bacterium]|nr:HEAT repeat domain-containing protein [Elusimicrobiota bacterium]
MNLLLVLSGLCLPFFIALGVAMWRARPHTRPGQASLALFVILLVQLCLMLLPIPFLSLALPAGLQNLLSIVQSGAAVLMTLDGFLFLAATALLALAWWQGEERMYLRRGALFAGLSLALNPFVLLWAIAGTETWFVGAVPIEQRLVSHNDAIRRKAQQELLGLDPAEKRRVTEKLMPELGGDDRFVRKWAAISVALIGPAAQEAIPSLLPGVSAPEKDVAQAFRVALSEIGAPDADQLPSLMQGLGDSRPAVECESAQALSKMGPAAREAIPLLVSRVKTSSALPECAAKALAALSDSLPEISSSTVELLHDPEVLARRNAAYALSLIGAKQPEAVDALLAILSTERDSDVRRMAARALSLPEAPDAGGLAPLIFSLRRSRNELVRLRALGQLRQAVWPLEQAIPTLARVLQRDPSPTLRLAAAQWLEQLGPAARPAADALAQALRDSDVTVRGLALSMLRIPGIRSREFAPRIAVVQRDPDPMLRCAAAQELVELGASDRVFVAMLVRDLKAGGESEACDAEALGMAGHFNEDVVPALVGLLGEANFQWRSVAARTLMELGPRARPALPALAKAQRDGVPGADIAIKALREMIPHTARRRQG